VGGRRESERHPGCRETVPGTAGGRRQLVESGSLRDAPGGVVGAWERVGPGGLPVVRSPRDRLLPAPHARFSATLAASLARTRKLLSSQSPLGVLQPACVIVASRHRQCVCCLLVLNLVSSTLPCIRQPRPRLVLFQVLEIRTLVADFRLNASARASTDVDDKSTHRCTITFASSAKMVAFSEEILASSALNALSRNS